MSVRTTADEKLDLAREGVAQAIAGLDAVVVERVWGWDEFSTEYRGQLRQIMNLLLEIRGDLG